MTNPMLAFAMLAIHAGSCLAQPQGFYFRDNEFDVGYDPAPLPDFDQVRDFSEMTPALPNAGRMYCAPTATTDVLAYLANTRTPFLRPFPEDWSQFTRLNPSQESVDKYNEMTQVIRDLGSLMSTSGQNGTRVVNQIAGTEQWLSQWTTSADLRDVFEVSSWGPDGADWTDNNITTIKPDEIGRYLWRGDVLTAYWGYYRVRPVNRVLLDREGGHVITPYRVNSDNPFRSPRMEFRNPSGGSGDNTIRQDIFRSTERSLVKTFFTDLDGDSMERFGCFRLDENINDQDFERTLRIMDGVVTISTRGVFAVAPGRNPLIFDQDLFAGTLIETEYPTVLPREVIEAELSPDKLSIAVLNRGDFLQGRAPGLYIQQLVGETNPVLIDGLTNPIDLRYTRQRCVIVMVEGELRLYNPYQLAEPQLTGVNDETNYDDMDVHDASDEVWLYSSQEGIVRRRDTRTLTSLGGWLLPATAPTRPERVRVNPADGSIWALSGGRLVRLFDGGEPQLILQEIETPFEPGCFSFDERGHLFLGEGEPGGEMLLHHFLTDQDQLLRLEETPFDGLIVEGCFEMTRGRHNLDHGLQFQPGSYNVPADELPENEDGVPDPGQCPADVNNDGILDNGDIGVFVSLFLAGSLTADFNGDGILDNGDIGAFVAAFLAGC